MKTLLLGMILLFTFQACSKKECYQCVKGVNIKRSGMPSITTKDTTEVCNLTPSDKADYEKDNSYTKNLPDGTEVAITICY